MSRSPQATSTEPQSVQHSMLMRRSLYTLAFAAAIGVFVASGIVAAVPPAAAQQIDFDVGPGNPVIGDDRPGDVQSVSETDYALWGLVAVCLIGAGWLLVKIEKWETKRIEHQVPKNSL